MNCLENSITVTDARRLALARAGLLKPEWAGFPISGSGKGKRAKRSAHRIIEQFGYLQLDTVSIAGARSHVIVLLSRLRGFDPTLGEKLLEPGEPLFEFWGHEASWMPLELYPLFAFRRAAMRKRARHMLAEHAVVACKLRRQIRTQGPIRSIDMEGKGSSGWWDFKLAKRVAAAMWSRGELAIRSRQNFQRSFDLTERVIPEAVRTARVSHNQAIEALLLRAAAGHGWANVATLAATWRLRNLRDPIKAALTRLQAKGEMVPCDLILPSGKSARGWIRPGDLDLAARLRRVRPRGDQGVLLSPFDPVLWDRGRVRTLFGFEQRLEIFKPKPERVYGYYCLPVLAGERLIGRVDLKADRKCQQLSVLARLFEDKRPSSADTMAMKTALERFANDLSLDLQF